MNDVQNKLKYKTLTIFIPLFNEAESLPKLFSDLLIVDKKFRDMNVTLEILIHDNSSSDMSWELITKWSVHFSNFRAYRFNRNIGYQQSLTLSFAKASGLALIVYQADQQDPIELVFEMYELWRQGNKCIVGVAKNRADGIAEKIGRLVFVRLFKTASDIKIKKWFTDFYLLDQTLYEQFADLPLLNQFIRGRIIENFIIDRFIPYDRLPRLSGKSKFNFAGKYSLALDALLLHSSKIIRKITIFGVSLSIIGFIIGIIFSVIFHNNNDHIRFAIAVTGSIGILLSSMLIILLGVVLEFLIRIHKRLHSSTESINFIPKLISESIEIANSQRWKS
jgi:dolichol-phosphate mannosyltransferase